MLHATFQAAQIITAHQLIDAARLIKAMLPFDQQLARALDRAVVRLPKQSWVFTPSTGVLKIDSSSQRDVEYTVTVGTCDCPTKDVERHDGQEAICYHRAAVRLLQVIAATGVIPQSPFATPVQS